MKFKYLLLFIDALFGQRAYCQENESAEELAKKLSKPIASLISVPFHNNTDFGMGTFDVSKNTLNIQPVIPIKLSDKLNLITRYIIPVVSQNDITSEGAKQFGLTQRLVHSSFHKVKELFGVVARHFYCR